MPDLKQPKLSPLLLIKYVELAGKRNRNDLAVPTLDQLFPTLPELKDNWLLALLNAPAATSNAKFMVALFDEIFRRPDIEAILGMKVLRMGCFEGDGPWTEALAQHLAQSVKPDQRAQFMIAATQIRLGPLQAFAVARQQTRCAQNADQSWQLASAAINAGRGILAGRYLRFHIRKWPETGRLCALAVQAFMLGGRTDLAREILGLSECRRLPLPEQDRLRFEVLARSGRDKEAQALLRSVSPASVRKIGLNFALKVELSQGDLDGAQAVRKEMGLAGRPHFGVSHLGQLLNELLLYKRFNQQDGPPSRTDMASFFEPARATVQGWIDAGYHRPARDLPLTRKIFQYWDHPTVPDGLEPVMQSWQTHDGWAYRRFDKASAVNWLRQTFPPPILRAFRLTRSAAEQADFFRLCVLAIEGGLYADADDLCLTSPEDYLAGTAGAVVFQEPFGAIANNLIYAPPRHPVMIQALRMARNALLSRGNESVWSKTGPGLMTRVVALYVDGIGPQDTLPDAGTLTILKEIGVRRHVQTGLPLPHKMTKSYWNVGGSAPSDLIRQSLKKARQGNGMALEI